MFDSTCCMLTVQAESQYGHEAARAHTHLWWQGLGVMPAFCEVGRLRAGFPAPGIPGSSLPGRHFAARGEQVSNP